MPIERKSSRYGIAALIELLKLKAGDNFVQVKTAEFGSRLGITQQAASLQLKELERRGLIMRKKSSGNRTVIKVSNLGIEIIGSVYSDLREALQSELREKREVTFHGKVFRGLGQAAFFISLHGYKKQFERVLGFVPYPGSLNIRLSSPIEIYQSRELKLNHEGIQLEGFTYNRKEYAPLKCFKALIMDSFQGAVLYTDRTHYNDSVIELISPERLRSKLKITEDPITGESAERVTVRVEV